MDARRRMDCRLLCIVGIVGTLATAGPAQAASLSDRSAGLIVLGAGAAIIASVGGGLVTGLFNGVSATQGKRPSSQMLGLGYFCGVFNLVGSAVLLGTLYGTHNHVSDSIRLGPAIAAAAAGSVGLGLTIWSHRRRETRSSIYLAVAPQLSLDHEGSPALGAGLRVAGW